MTNFTNPITGKYSLKNFREVTPAYSNAAAAYAAWATALGVSSSGSDESFGTDSTHDVFFFSIPCLVIGGTSPNMAISEDGIMLFEHNPTGLGFSPVGGNYGYGGVNMYIDYLADHWPTVMIGVQETTSPGSSGCSLFGNTAKVRRTSDTIIGIFTRGTGDVGSGQTAKVTTAFKFVESHVEIFMTSYTSTDMSLYVVAANETTNATTDAAHVKTGLVSATTAFLSDDLAVFGSLAENVQVTTNPLPGWNARDVLIDTFNETTTLIAGWARIATDVIQIASTAKVDYGQLLKDTLGLHDALTPAVRYAASASDIISWADALSAGFSKSVSDQINVSSALTGTLALTVLANLQIVDLASPRLSYRPAVVEMLQLHDSLRNFLAATIVAGIGISELPTPTYRPLPVLVDTIGIAGTLSPHMIFRVLANENVKFTDTELLHMIFSGIVDDTVQITAGYLSPGDEFTTWALNTRTSAVTEYKDYNFNSFAKLGMHYVGASSGGVYSLSGDTDNAADIIADIKSGMMQLGGFKFSSFKAAYVGIRGTGDFVLRLITGEGVTRDYALKAQDMKATRVNLGKGLRARFFAFELISSGQDFDLDGVELIPIIAERRV